MTRRIAIAFCIFLAPAAVARAADGPAQVGGLVTACGKDTMELLGPDGRTTVRGGEGTKIALSVNWRQLGDVPGEVRIPILCLPDVVAYKLPTDTWYARKTVRSNQTEADLKAAIESQEITAFGLTIQAAPLADHLPTKAEPFFAGRFRFARGKGKPATLTVGEKAFEVHVRRGQTSVPVYGLAGRADCKPWVTRARVTARKDGESLVAEEVVLSPVGDQAAADDSKLPRMLVVGDSISLNYLGPLRKALAGKVNVHHPPTNCGRSITGANNVAGWLGDYTAKGRHWDAISFNFGHWDAGNTKAAYQGSLEAVIAELAKTRAKLIWVTTCPVPEGCPKAGELSADGQAPGRKAGVMAKYLNPWALEVMERHPEIAVCDQWQLVEDGRGGVFKEWWKGDNVHFAGEQAEALARLLAEKVAEALAKRSKE